MTDRQRREDHLEELVAQMGEINRRGSENFRAYRRRSTIAFVLLAIGMSGAIWLAQHNASVARKDLARETAARARILAEQAHKTAEQAKYACIRTRLIVPPLADGLERARVLRGRDLALFRSTIPKSC